MRNYKFVMLVLVCCLAFIGNYMQYQVSAFALQIMPALGIDAVGFSALFLIPMLAAFFFGVPFGVFGDKWGPKRVVGVLFCFSFAGAVIRTFTLDSFPLQLVSMFLIGIGMTALQSNAVKILSLWFEKRADTTIGGYFAVSCLGIVVAQATGGLFESVTQGYGVAALATGVLVVCWNVFGRDASGELRPAEQDSEVLYAFQTAAKKRDVWLVALACGCTLAATTAYAGFLPQALEAGKGIDGLLAGNMAALVTVASIFGCVAGPAFAGRFKQLKAYLVVTNVLAALVMFITWYAASGALLWTVLFLNGFITSMTGPILQAMPVHLKGIGSKYAGSASGIIQTVSLLMAFLLPIMITSLAGSDYTMNMGLESLCFLASIVPILLLARSK